jgi:hypothetical protein
VCQPDHDAGAEHVGDVGPQGEERGDGQTEHDEAGRLDLLRKAYGEVGATPTGPTPRQLGITPTPRRLPNIELLPTRNANRA